MRDKFGAALTGILTTLMMAGPAAAQDYAPNMLYGQWSIGETADCASQVTMIIAASGGFASTLGSDHNRVEAVGTWTLDGIDLKLNISELLSLDQSVPVTLRIRSLEADSMIAFDPTAADGPDLVLHRCN